jgi:D-serine deaminase-like pyridoxal phosphate-dependent protein
MPPRTIHELPTPALLLDADVLERNVARMADKVRGLGARLRPHVKTHKCIEIGRLQQRHGAQGLTVATIAEAQAFAAAGFDDITWALPVPLSRLDEIIALARRITLRLLVDSAAAVDGLAAAASRAGIRLHVFLEVDCHYHRSGVDPNDRSAPLLAGRIADSPHLVFDGILTHAGHGYHARTHPERVAVAREEREVMVAFAERLRAAGLDVPCVSVGSTPTMAAVESLAGVDEARPGNYAFYDWMQAAVGVCGVEDVALSVLATVISHQPGASHAIVDAGALAMSKDAGPGHGDLRRGLGPLLAGPTGGGLDPDLMLTAVSQEHGFVGAARPDALRDRLPVGARVRILPNHSCLTAALFDHYWVVRGEAIQDHWTIHRGR